MMTPDAYEDRRVRVDAACEQWTRLIVRTEHRLEAVDRFLATSRARYAAAKARFEQKIGKA